MNLYRADGWVKSTLGQAIAGAQVYICLEPTDASWVPPVPLASIFADPQGLAQITQPIITDGFGHYDYYAASGVPYTEVVVTGGKVQAVYQDQVPMGATLGLPPGSGTVTNTLGPLIVGSLVIGNGGSDIQAGPALSGIATQYLDGTGHFSTPSGVGIGTVTSVAAGTGLSASPSSPITGSGTINLADLSPSPAGTYTLAGITVNAQGQITAASSGSAGVGTVTHTAGNLTANALVVGNAVADITVLSSLGTTTTVLHGNASGLPSFSSVVEGDLGLTDITTANVSSAAHGFAPKNNGNATYYLNGAGGYSIPAGSGSGTVNSGTGGQLAYYASTGTAVSGDADATISGGVLTLGVASSVAGELVLAQSTAYATTIAGAASANWTLTLPSTAGINLYVLQTDGSGNTSWVPQSGGGGGGGLPTPDVARFALWEAGMSGLGLTVTSDVVGLTGSGETYSYNPPTSTSGMSVLLYSSSAGPWYFNGLTFVYPANGFVIEGTAQVTESGGDADGNFFCGLSATPSSQYVGPYPWTQALVMIGQRKAHGGAFGNWQLVTNGDSASNFSFVDSGVPVVSGTRYKFKITFDGTTATLYINGTSVCSTTTNVPSTTPLGGVWWAGRDNGYNTWGATFEYLYITTPTP